MADNDALVVYIVDDDASIRDSLSLLLGLRGYRTASFADAERFLATLSPNAHGCVMADLKMPGLSGIELMQALKRRGHPIPVIIITAHGDVAAARAAFKSDAVDFLEKPFDENGPVTAIEAAFARERARLERRVTSERRVTALAQLTEREREVATLLTQGHHNRDIAANLGISPRTVEVHKARILDKTRARGLADLIRMLKID